MRRKCESLDPMASAMASAEWTTYLSAANTLYNKIASAMVGVKRFEYL